MMSGKFLSTIVTQMGNKKKGILTNDATTIVEKFDNPIPDSEKINKVSRFFKSAGKQSIESVSKENYFKKSGADKSGVFSSHSKNEEISSLVKKYNKGEVDRFGEYKAPKAPKNNVKNTDYIVEAIDEFEDDKEEYPFRLLGGEYGQPTIMITCEEMPELKMLAVGDKVCMEIEATVSNYDFSENETGMKRKTYTLKIKKAKLEEYAVENSEEW